MPYHAGFESLLSLEIYCITFKTPTYGLNRDYYDNSY